MRSARDGRLTVAHPITRARRAESSAANPAAADPGPARPWLGAGPPLLGGDPQHRGRDSFFVTGSEQWLIAKFSYGLLDSDLHGEEVDIYLLRGCGSLWERLGTTLTTEDGEHPTVEGVADSGGRVFFRVPTEHALGVGRHRVRFVVAGDLSATDAFVEVVPPGSRIFASDVDGTLTSDENAETLGLLTGTLPEANADAASILTLLATKGYRPWYLTARPEWLVERTREFLAERGFPPGILHTTLSATGASGAAAAEFKTQELELHAQKGLTPSYAFGNTATDAEAYAAGGVAPDERRIFYRFDDEAFAGRRIEAYAELRDELDAAEPACR